MHYFAKWIPGESTESLVLLYQLIKHRVGSSMLTILLTNSGSQPIGSSLLRNYNFLLQQVSKDWKDAFLHMLICLFSYPFFSQFTDNINRFVNVTSVVHSIATSKDIRYITLIFPLQKWSRTLTMTNFASFVGVTGYILSERFVWNIN